jgi:aldehyde dehydrogenase (NAD+)
MFVLEDADVGRAARGAWFGLTLNRGQTCIAVRRVFVQRSRYAAFAEAMKPFAAGAKPLPLLTPGQVAQAERLVKDAVGRGATAPAPAPGSLPPGVVPTILFDANPDMAVCREAAFAPVCAVIPFDTVDDAVSLAAQSPFGLGASVFTADTRAAEELAARVSSGSVTVNDVIAPTAHPATPFGGRGASGWGVTQGPDGLLGMTVPQVVTVRKGRFRPHFDEAVAPDPAATLDVLRGLLRASHGRGWREWFGGVRQLLRGVRRKK